MAKIVLVKQVQVKLLKLLGLCPHTVGVGHPFQWTK